MKTGGDFIINFGKYKGLPIRVVNERDSNYLNWCMETFEIGKHKAFINALQTFLNRKPTKTVDLDSAIQNYIRNNAKQVAEMIKPYLDNEQRKIPPQTEKRDYLEQIKF